MNFLSDMFFHPKTREKCTIQRFLPLDINEVIEGFKILFAVKGI